MLAYYQDRLAGFPLPLLTGGNAKVLRHYLLITVCFFSVVRQVQAQAQDTTLELPQVVVRDTLFDANLPLTTQTLPAERLRSGQYFSLGQALQDEGLLFLKTYGLGSLATANVRGAAASQTTISWNDVPIQSPMLGLLDLSLLPVVQVDEVGIAYDQAIGGNIFLRTHQPDTGILLRDGLTVGSFGQVQKTFSVEGGRRLRYKLSTQLDKARNDFPFQLRANLPEQRQTNAELEQRVFQQSFFWQASSKHRFELHLWQQRTQRQIPPTSVETRSAAYQNDEVYRQQLRWKAVGKRAVWQTNLAHLREDIFYANPIILFEAPSNFRSWLLQTKRQATVGQSTSMATRLRLQRTTALANGYAESGQQDLAFANQSIEHYFAHQFKLTAAVEVQLTQEQRSAYGWRATIGQSQTSWAWQLGVHRNFRIPTLNDLLWVPGGNPQLRAETSLGQSLSIRKSLNLKGSQIHLELFNRAVDNWIQWAQRDDQPLWSAQNVTAVWSRGVQLRVDQSFRWQKISGALRSNYQWTRSTYQVAVTNPSIEAGEQLWYTPEHQGFVQIQFNKEAISLLYTHRFVSSSVGVNDDLAAYDLGEIQLEYRPVAHPNSHAFLRVANLWNTEYRIIERRPMPGQQWQLGYRVSFQL